MIILEHQEVSCATSVKDISIATSVVTQESGRTFILINDTSPSSRNGATRNNYVAPKIREAGQREKKTSTITQGPKLEKLKSSVAVSPLCCHADCLINERDEKENVLKMGMLQVSVCYGGTKISWERSQEIFHP